MKTNAAGQAESIFVASFPRSVRVLRAVAFLTLHPGPFPVRGAGLSAHLPLLDTTGLAGMAGKVRNPKQFPMSKGASPQNKAAASGLIGRVLRICHLNFVLVSDFEFRISDLSSQGSDSRGSKF